MAWHETYLIKEAARYRGMDVKALGQLSTGIGKAISGAASGTMNLLRKALTPKTTSLREVLTKITDPAARRSAMELFKRDPARWEQLMRQQGHLSGTFKKGGAARELGRVAARFRIPQPGGGMDLINLIKKLKGAAKGPIITPEAVNVVASRVKDTESEAAKRLLEAWKRTGEKGQNIHARRLYKELAMLG
jgi:hypothetical protein